MRSAPAFAMDFDAHAARPWACALTCVAFAVGGQWSAQRAGWDAGPAAIIAAAVALTASILAWRWLRPLPSRLRWDGLAWYLGPLPDREARERQGELQARIDMAGWMLLRFRTDAPPGAAVTRWFALRRRDCAGQWHLLQCAVYSPRPAAAPGAADRRASIKIPNDRP